jgi:hypothetical protein
MIGVSLLLKSDMWIYHLPVETVSLVKTRRNHNQQALPWGQQIKKHIPIFV